MLCCTQCPGPAAGRRRPTPAPQTPGHSRASLGQSLVGSLLLSPGSWCAQSSVCALQNSVSPVLCKFWWLYGGVNGDFFQEGLCHTQVCCTQSPCPCGRPLLTRSSAGDTQTQFWLSLCGVSGSWCTQGMFEPSEHLWRGRGLILNMMSPLLPSCWGFSFTPGCGVSPQSRSAQRSCRSSTAALFYWAWPRPSKQNPVSPSVSLSHQEVSINFLSLSIRGQTE